jgi:ribosome biogenesis GTPase
VAVQPGGSGGRGLIHAVLERTSFLSRKEAGPRTAEQGLCANVDVAFIVSSFSGERGLVPRRIERFLTLAYDSGIRPVIVLNKSDLCADVELQILRAEAVAGSAPVYAVSALTGEGMESAFSGLSPGKTAVLLGASGVGKSSLINALLGRDDLKTGDVRAADGRGRHITTWRELIVVPEKGIIMDTPGLRELQLWADGDAVEQSFGDVSQLAEACRFRDCSHRTEPGCAVLAAVGEGSLDKERFESYVKQQDELVYLESRRSEHASQHEKAKWKSIHRSVKTFNKINPKRRWERSDD